MSSAHRAVVEYSNLTNNASGDTFHITSDQGTYINTVTIRNNYVHDPVVSGGAHYDGLQLRGATNVLIQCNNFDLGTYKSQYNAPVFIEGDNGGHSGVVVNENWLLGGAFSFMFGNDNDATRLTNNRFGGDMHWGPLCYAPKEPRRCRPGTPSTVRPPLPARSAGRGCAKRWPARSIPTVHQPVHAMTWAGLVTPSGEFQLDP